MERVRNNYKGKIFTLIIGGNEREKAVCGGHMSLPFMVTPYQKPLLALEVYDFIPPDYNHFLKKLWPEENFIMRVKQAASYSPDALCLRFISTDPDSGITLKEEPQELLKKVITETKLPLIITGCGIHTVDEELIPLLSEAIKGENALIGIASEENYQMLAVSCLANGHSLIAETPDDLNIAKQLNILITDLGLPIERIAIHHATAALGYGLEYTYSIMEKCRLAALEGDTMLSPVMINFVGKETWKTKEAQESEEMGINWEVITSLAYLEAGADILVIEHPESFTRLRNILNSFASNESNKLDTFSDSRI
jgi:acetyl-CoA decarbonylase/synthase complex subunit delta